MKCRTSKIILVALLVVLVGLAGRREAGAFTTCGININAACTITSAGSYTVTGDFSVASSSNSGSACNQGGATGTGICISTGVNNVSINLNGHTIMPASSTNVAAAISDASVVGGSGSAGVTVVNGIIDGGNSTNGFSFAGVLATGARARVERLQVRNSGSGAGKAAIRLGNAAVIAKNVVNNGLNSNNNATEIVCGIDCVISHNVANASGGLTGTTGISTGNGGVVEENTVMGNATGLSLATTTGYGENVLANVNNHNVSGGASMKNNVCSGTIGC